MGASWFAPVHRLGGGGRQLRCTATAQGFRQCGACWRTFSRPGVGGQRLTGQPARDGDQVLCGHALDDFGHAVRGVGAALRGLPGAELRVQVIKRQAQEPRHVGLHPGQSHAVALGAGAAVLGHPAAAVAMLVNHLGERGQVLPAGSLVLSGGVTEAIAVKAGDHVNLRIQGLGSVSLRFV
jgi:hypothetical protein